MKFSTLALLATSLSVVSASWLPNFGRPKDNKGDKPYYPGKQHGGDYGSHQHHYSNITAFPTSTDCEPFGVPTTLHTEIRGSWGGSDNRGHDRGHDYGNGRGNDRGSDNRGGFHGNKGYNGRGHH